LLLVTEGSFFFFLSMDLQPDVHVPQMLVTLKLQQDVKALRRTQDAAGENLK
jgi:hypothetical protein